MTLFIKLDKTFTAIYQTVFKYYYKEKQKKTINNGYVF